ncbi:MAG: hypothetical protein II886_13175 [Prevotella sp.]|nr:hypothetical protein [Prevotella sp.]
MKKTVKVSVAALAHRILSASKYTCLSDAEKVQLWRITRQLAPVATKYDGDVQDAREKMMPDDGFQGRWDDAVRYQTTQKGMTEGEYLDFNIELRDYNKLVRDAVKEYGDKEVTLEFEPLSEESFCHLMASNDWNMDQAVTVGELIVE